MRPACVIARRGPTRETALFTADATPDRSVGTERISAVVSGATMTISPMPKMRNPGNRSVQ